MSTNHTPNYQLSQWEPGDPVLREDFNRDNQVIDETLRYKGNCCIVQAAYRGTGKYGATNLNEATMPWAPALAFIIDRVTGKFLIYGEGTEASLSPWYPSSPVIFSYHISQHQPGVFSCKLSWYGDSVDHQFNVEGRDYTLIAIYQSH